jgi:hypothetical protein
MSGQIAQLHPIGTCEHCGKGCWTSKKIAKAAARRNHPGERLSVYECGRWWHYGHLDYPVLRGIKARGMY